MLTQVPPTDCMRAREGASARVDGELNELESAWLDLHLRECPDCRTFTAGISAAAGLARRAPLEPAPAGMFIPRRRHIAPPAVAATVAALAIAATTGMAFLLGQQVGQRSAAHAVGITQTTTRSGVRLDPGLFAALRSSHLTHGSNRRVVAV